MSSEVSYLRLSPPRSSPLPNEVASADMRSTKVVGSPSPTAGWDVRPWEIWVTLAVIALVVVLFEATMNGSFVGSDDAYIHLRYIANLRETHVFGFNPGQSSNGSTSPLWVLIASLLPGNTANLPDLVKALSVFLFTGSIFLFYELSRQLLPAGVPRYVALLAPVLYASDPWLLKWGGSDMESSLAAVLLLGSILLAFRANRTKRYLVGASLSLGISTLARPEIALFFAVFVLALITGTEGLANRAVKGVAAVIAYCIPLIPWLVFSILAFGSPIPNTFVAKTVESTTSALTVAVYFLEILIGFYWPWLLVGAILAITTGTRPNLVRTLRGDFKKRLLAVLWGWCAAIPIFYTLSRLQTPSTRYLQITTPILLLVGIQGLIFLARSLWPTSDRRHLPVLITAAVVLVVLYNSALNALVVLPSSREFTNGVLAQYRQIGVWLNLNTAPTSRIAVAADVGAIGYYSQRQIIDLAGLNTPQVIPYLPNSLNYVFVSKPAYLVITGETRQYMLLRDRRFARIATPVLSLPLNAGLRKKFGQTSGDNRGGGEYATVYRLHW